MARLFVFYVFYMSLKIVYKKLTRRFFFGASFALFVFHERFGKLVGAGGALAADNTAEFVYYIVYFLPYGKFCDSL